MKRLGPVLTLAVGAVMTVALGVLSATTSPTTQNVNAQGEPAPVAEATSEASAPPAPVKSVKPVPAKADYAGRVQGNGGLIAVSIRNGKAVGYFCDGRIEAWMKGKAADGRVTLSGPGNASVVAKLGGGKASGTLEFGSRKWDFTAPTVKKPSGLYRASAIVRGAQVRAGWIYLDDGSRVGLTLVDGEPAEVAIPEPGENATVNGEEVDPKDVDEFIGEIS
ncbi:hypothetical protein HS041_37665 [Planomonospora sp. ID67723]|uniref:hypothetical protein n=1 Tax=Planomonospora sp. ID67723 TaxID=2738134 RepID=UPI0018C4342B|nr:hypothetical protein [Planomonospora sp. ID67723]MBG0833432.1 hypothetical protein [Planomonospora sp. ID67723]